MKEEEEETSQNWHVLSKWWRLKLQDSTCRHSSPVLARGGRCTRYRAPPQMLPLTRLTGVVRLEEAEAALKMLQTSGGITYSSGPNVCLAPFSSQMVVRIVQRRG